MKKPHLVPVAAVLSLALVGSAMAGLMTPKLAAASPPSIDQWPGNVVIDYQAPDGQQATNLPDYLSDPAPSVSSIFNTALTTDSAGICNQIEQQIAIRTKQAFPLKDWHCTLPDRGDLQAAQPAANDVGLTYLVDGNSISFNYAGVPGGATVDATFDMEFTLSLNFAGQVIAGSGTPVDVVSSSLGLSNAHFSSKNVLLNAFGGKKLKQADAAMNSYTVSPATDVLNLDPEIATINSQILAAVGPLTEDVAPDGSWCGLGGCPNQPGQIASALFDLSVTVDASNLDLVFSRGRSPPPPRSGARSVAAVPILRRRSSPSVPRTSRQASPTWSCSKSKMARGAASESKPRLDGIRPRSTACPSARGSRTPVLLPPTPPGCKASSCRVAALPSSSPCAASTSGDRCATRPRRSRSSRTPSRTRRPVPAVAAATPGPHP